MPATMSLEEACDAEARALKLAFQHCMLEVVTK